MGAYNAQKKIEDERFEALDRGKASLKTLIKVSLRSQSASFALQWASLRV